MEQQIQRVLVKLGENLKVLAFKQIRGGEISDTFYAKTSDREYFIKFKQGATSSFFECEVEGLLELQKSQMVRTPEVYGFGEIENYAFLVMEWISGHRSQNSLQQLGESIARLHQVTGTAFGFKSDNMVGNFPQFNKLNDSWIDFYRDSRLLPQMEIANKKGLLPKETLKKLDRLLGGLDKWLPANCSPSLLHGDLWDGNWLAGPGGVPYLIDPAVYYGHYEVELAYTELFGRFPDEFYHAYKEVHPISPDYADRRELYQIYQLINHLNHFGLRYLEPINQVLKYYVG